MPQKICNTLYIIWSACHHKILIRTAVEFPGQFSHQNCFPVYSIFQKWMGSSCHIILPHHCFCPQCRTTYSAWGRYLKGHVRFTQNVKDIGECLVLCSKDQRCKKINFQFRDLVCQLNDADRHTDHCDYELKDGYACSDYLARVSAKNL